MCVYCSSKSVHVLGRSVVYIRFGLLRIVNSYHTQTAVQKKFGKKTTQNGVNTVNTGCFELLSSPRHAADFPEFVQEFSKAMLEKAIYK